MKPLTEQDASDDCYRNYTDGGRLFSQEYQENPVLICAEDIATHFAGTTYMHMKDGESHHWLHVLPLDR